MSPTTSICIKGARSGIVRRITRRWSITDFGAVPSPPPPRAITRSGSTTTCCNGLPVVACPKYASPIRRDLRPETVPPLGRRNCSNAEPSGLNRNIPDDTRPKLRFPSGDFTSASPPIEAVDPPVRAPAIKMIRHKMRVPRLEPREQTLHLVRLAIPVRVAQKNNVRLMNRQSSPRPGKGKNPSPKTSPS